MYSLNLFKTRATLIFTLNHVSMSLDIALHQNPAAKVSRSSGKEMDVVVKHISKSKKTATGFLCKNYWKLGAGNKTLGN